MSGSAMSGRSSGRVERDIANNLLRGTNGSVSSNDSGTPPVPHRRVRPALAESIIASLSPTEVVLVQDLGRLRLASGGQIQRLHFEATSSGQRQARRTLTGLSERRVLARLGRSIGGRRAGSAGYVYTLDVVGQRLIHPEGDMRRPWLSSTGFVRHAVMVSECYVQLVEAERSGQMELDSFEPEPACWRPFVNRRGSHEVLKPDGFAVVAIGEFEDRWFVECDRGTEDIPRVLAKCRRYVQYWQTGKEAVFPRVLWVTTRGERAAALARALSRLPEEQRRLFAVCEQADFVGTIAGGAGEEEMTNDTRGGET